MSKSLLEFGHILRWCLKDNAPVPRTHEELDEWAAALDEKVDDLRRYEPGALLSFATPEERASGLPITAARRGFQRRLVETPGVVATTNDGEHVSCSIYVRAVTYKMHPITEQHFEKLRRTMMTPDDWDVTPVDVWRHARELALGLHYAWDPRPPLAWRQARRVWFAFVRDVLSRSRTLDSPEHVANACDSGKLPFETLEAWRSIKDTFMPNVVPRWHDDSALHVCVEWMKTPGIVWTEHALFAERLSEMTRASYYGEAGLDEAGRFIDDADPNHAIIASIKANREGRNLQAKWSRNLVVSPPENAGAWQQLIGRTHRPGQKADEVIFDVFLGCAEHANAMRKALSGAAAVRDTTGAPAKLLIADIDWPSDAGIASYAGARWH
jgi:hypothetical protein